MVIDYGNNFSSILEFEEDEEEREERLNNEKMWRSYRSEACKAVSELFLVGNSIKINHKGRFYDAEIVNDHGYKTRGFLSR